MNNGFPQLPEFSGPLEPVRADTEVFDLLVEGAIPDSVRGAFVRVQPDPLYPPMLGHDIFFNGDGAVSSFRIQDGRVDLIHKYVETERLKRQKAARRSLFGIYRNRFTNDPSTSDRNFSTANTNVIAFADRLLALKEDSLPYALDPLTLETIGVDDLGGQVTSTAFTAHPKMDPQTEHFLAFAYEAMGDGTDDVVFYEFDPQGRKIRETWVKAPFVGMIHDFAVTPGYVIFPLMPIKVDLERMRAGGRHFEWDPEQDMLFGIMKRNGDGSDIRWMRLPPGFPGHVLNAFEEGSAVCCDISVGNGNAFPFFPAANGYSTPLEELYAPLKRLRFDMSSPDDAGITEDLTQISVEFGRIDDRVSGQPYRYGFAIGQDWQKPFHADRVGSPHPFFFNVLAKVDTQNKTTVSWWPGPEHSLQEPVFIPRSGEAPEGDGYLLCVVNRLADSRSELVLLDTASIEDGPIATIRCPIRLRSGLHGNWVPASSAG